MWGNKLGWGISAAIVAFFFFMIYLLIAAGQPSPPTSFTSEKVLAALTPPVNPTDVVPSMTDSTDSTEHYRTAINDYLKNSTRYRTIVERKKYTPDDLKLTGVQALLKARTSNNASIFKSHLDEVINYDNEKDSLDALMKVAQAVEIIGLLRNTEKEKDAMQYFEATFSLGYKMYQERLRYEELFKGYGLMGGAIETMIRFADRTGDKKRMEALREVNNARLDYFKQTLEPVNGVISAIDDKVVARHAGDILKLATDSKERLWRIEAVLKLGRHRYNVDRKGDQLTANRMVRAMAETESDPAVKLAAIAARDLTIEKYRMLQ